MSNPDGNTPPSSTASNRKFNLIGWLKWLGPGFITAALVFGPGSLTLASTLGADYGYTFLWVIVVATIFMMVFTNMAIRIGLATDQSLLTSIRQRYGSTVSILIGVGLFLVAASFQAGNSVAVGMAFAEPTNTPITPWIVGWAVISISLLFFKSFYTILEKLMLVMVAIMLISFIGTLILTGPSLSGIISGLIPSIPEGSILLVVAVVASNFSVAGAFYQAYLVQEKSWKASQYREANAEGLSGIFVLGSMGAVILMCAAAVLQPMNISIESATDMAIALQPLFGNQAVILFMIGLFGAAFSGLVANATLGGNLLSDALGYGSKLSNLSTRLCIMGVMALGAVVAVIYGGNPIGLIVFAQGLTIFIVPFIGIVLFLMANSEEVTGSLRIGTGSRVLGVLGILVLFVLAFRNALMIFS